MDRILIAAHGAGPPTLLEQTLRARGYDTKVAERRAAVPRLVRVETLALFILDVEPPAEGWISTLRDVRTADPRLQVMVLTPEGHADEGLTALEREADEFVTKPFAIDELLARVRGRLRERTRRRQRFLRAGDIALDLDRRAAEVRGRPVELTARELKLLEVLMRHPDEVLSRERLLANVWGYDYDPGSNVVAVYVGYLRDKLGAEAIETVRGAGYRLRD
jgi:DNA-binding response OmpR family regulator